MSNAYFLTPSRSQPDYIALSGLVRAISKHADLISGRVLDYGCGTKPYSALFKHVTEYVGADLPTNPDADVHLDETGRLPTAGAFDAVLSTEVLEHVPNVDLYLSECRRVLADRRGRLLLTTSGIWMYHPHPTDMYRWTHEGLVHTIERFGFKTIVIEPVTTGTRALLQLLGCRLYQRWFHGRQRRHGFRLHSRIANRVLNTLPGPLGYRAINLLADMFGEYPDRERRLRDLPLNYLYVGQSDS